MTLLDSEQRKKIFNFSIKKRMKNAKMGNTSVYKN